MKFTELREELDCLGYRQKLTPDCVPLVEKLLFDLNTTTENLQKYMRISQHVIEERDLLELGAEPYKCDNAKLIRECNNLHQAFIHFKEQHERLQRDLRFQISNLTTELDNCNFEKKKLVGKIQKYEREKGNKPPQQNLDSKERQLFKLKHSMSSLQATNSQISNQLTDLGRQNGLLSDDNKYLKNQLKTRDEEIQRLNSIMEGGRPYGAASKDCCYKNIDSQIASLQDEITHLNKEKANLQLQLKDAIAKQHEAMRRALHLAERNKQLEKELKDVDQIALAVEAECNNTVKGSSQKVARLQDRINESLMLVQNMERENMKLKQAKLELGADLEAVKLEKSHWKKQLEDEQQQKKVLSNRVNSLTIIENDLNLEIDRLSKLNAQQKRRIIELESQTTYPKSILSSDDEVINHKVHPSDGTMPTKTGSLKSKQSTNSKKSTKKSPTKTKKADTVSDKNGSPAHSGKCCCESDNCIKNLRDLLDKEVEYRHVHAKKSMEDLKEEKEYYKREYHKVVEQMRNVPNYEISENGIAKLKQQLKDKDDRIRQLEQQIGELRKDRSAHQFIGEIHRLGSTNGSCTNLNCKNKERELELKSGELGHLEVENNTLKAKLTAFSETTVFNEERMKKAFKDMEAHIRKLEDERRDLVKAETSHRSNVSHLEDEYRNVKEELKMTQGELATQRAGYYQLKSLHEQTDRALSEAQARILHAETELASYKSKIKDSSRDTEAQDSEIAKLTSDLQFMKKQLSKLDKEKDDLMNKLDEKTERIADLEDQLDAKNKLIARLEGETKDINRKLSKYVNETTSQDHLVRSKQQELTILEQDYEKEKRLKEAAILENKRLQNDLSSATCDCREARKELEICKRQVEDLKRQLQHYVAEVKRTEDLISQKELERSELLDQFQSLSKEADILESNNHTLETQANHSKIQLSVALDHTSELENHIEHKESVIKSYEKQIADLTAHIARLEVQLKQNTLELESSRVEMKQMRDLCVKLDKDKDELKSEVISREAGRSQVQKLSDKLNAEKETLQRALDQEKHSLEAVEKLLSETRRDVTEQRLLNQDLQREVGRLKLKIDDLEGKLRSLKPASVRSQYPKPSHNRKHESTKQTESERLSFNGDMFTTIMTPQDMMKSQESLMDLSPLRGSNSDCNVRCDKLQCQRYKKGFYKANQQEGKDRSPSPLVNVAHDRTSENEMKHKPLTKTTKNKAKPEFRKQSLQIPYQTSSKKTCATNEEIRKLCLGYSSQKFDKDTSSQRVYVEKSLSIISSGDVSITKSDRYYSSSEPNVCDGSKNSSIEDISINQKRKANIKQGEEKLKRNEVYSKFDQTNESSAVFRKVFQVDGVGLQCECCISGFKLQDS